jgi:hypothetical protein
MANTTTIILKNSGTTGNTPTAANLEFGELALNYADGLLFYKAANGTVLSISGSGGGGGGGTGNGQAAYDQANTALLIAQSAFNNANTKYTQNSSPLLVNNLVNFTTGDIGTIRSNNSGINLISNNFVQIQYNPNPFTSAENSENSSWVFVDSSGVFLEAIDSPATGNYAGVYVIQSPSEVKIFSRLNVFTFGSNTLTFPDNTSQSTAYYSTVFDTANNAYNKANSANVVASGAFDRANGANIVALAAFAQANIANTTSVAAFAQANTANTTSVAAFAQANTANTTSVAAFAQANTANTTAIAAFGRANTANTTSVAAFAQANTANTTAIAAFAQANTAYSGAVLKTGNTMTGQLIMSVGTASSSQNTGSIVVNGGVGISGNIYISNVSSYGFANTSNVSVAKIQYNSACNSIDFVFG